MAKKMHKTSEKYCKECKYHGSIHSGYMTCDRYLITKKRRECPIGYCDKFEKGKPERDKVKLNLSTAPLHINGDFYNER